MDSPRQPVGNPVMTPPFGERPDFRHPPRSTRTTPVQQSSLGMVRMRPVCCSVCQRRVLPAQLLDHMQTEHGGQVFSRTASGLPRGIWFSTPAPARRLR
jgi:hypothetical protein